MQFTLVYRGELKANRGAKDKGRLRQHFHHQLEFLWKQAPLSECQGFLDPSNEMGCMRFVGREKFVALVTQKNRTLVRLAITLLRPGTPGHLFHAGGDIDNRLKTLLDALRMPANEQEIFLDSNEPELDCTYCLLEDDKLIESISVTTDRLLEPVKSSSEILALIHVTTRSMNSAVLWQMVSG